MNKVTLYNVSKKKKEEKRNAEFELNGCALLKIRMQNLDVNDV
jgi:hypothetical protein